MGEAYVAGDGVSDALFMFGSGRRLRTHMDTSTSVCEDS